MAVPETLVCWLSGPQTSTFEAPNSLECGVRCHSAMTMELSCFMREPAKSVTAKVASRGFPGQAGLKNVEGKARRRRQYECTARSRNAAIGIFSGPRLRPAIVVFQTIKKDRPPLQEPALKNSQQHERGAARPCPPQELQLTACPAHPDRKSGHCCRKPVAGPYSLHTS